MGPESGEGWSLRVTAGRLLLLMVRGDLRSATVISGTHRYGTLIASTRGYLVHVLSSGPGKDWLSLEVFRNTHLLIGVRESKLQYNTQMGQWCWFSEQHDGRLR